MLYALGCAQYKLAESAGGGADAYKDAREAFDALANAKDPMIARNAAFNRANCLAQAAKAAASDPKGQQAALGQLRSAASAYEDFLRQYPGDTGAQQNLDHVRFVMKKMQRASKQDDKQDQKQDDKKPPQEPPASLAVRNAQTEIPGAKAEVGDDNMVKLVKPVQGGAR